MLAVILNFSEEKFSSKLKKVRQVLTTQVMNPTIDHLLQIPELKEGIFSYLDPTSVKTASLVSR